MRHGKFDFRLALFSAIAFLTAFASSASSQVLFFPQTEIEGITFSGLLLTATPARTRGDVEYQIRCLATATDKGVEKNLEISFVVLGKNGKVLRTLGRGGSSDPVIAKENNVAECHSGSGPFPNPGAPPEQLALQLVVHHALAQRTLELKPEGLPNFADAPIDGFTFSSLQLTPSKDGELINYQVMCSVSGQKNVIRTISRMEFFLFEANAKVPFEWVPGRSIIVRNGVAEDCHTATGNLPNSGRTPAGMVLQYTEKLPPKSSKVVLQPIRR